MNKATTEFENKVSNGRITVENPQDTFVFVEASKLSLDDEFMKYKPKTEREEEFKEQLTEAIRKGIRDFWAPKYDPSLNKEGIGICYVPGKTPAVDRSYNWWEKTAKEFRPERQSHLGPKSERAAFWGWYIKKLIQSGWKAEDAWYAVCDDSKKLGHYWNSKNAEHALEKTGSREVCGFCDLANTFKILAYDEEAGGFWLSGGFFNFDSCNYPLAGLVPYHNRDHFHNHSVGWIVYY